MSWRREYGVTKCSERQYLDEKPYDRNQRQSFRVLINHADVGVAIVGLVLLKAPKQLIFHEDTNKVNSTANGAIAPKVFS